MRRARLSPSLLRSAAALALLGCLNLLGSEARAQSDSEGETAGEAGDEAAGDKAAGDDEGGNDDAGSSEPAEKSAKTDEAEEADDGPSMWAGPYEKSPYAKPVLSAVVFGEQGQAFVGVGLGARAGIRYQNDNPGADIVGDAYVSGQYIVGGASGWDIRIGDMTGPFYKFVGIGTGPEIAINRFGYGTGNSAVDLGQASTLRWTLSPYILTKVFDLSVGVAPGWYVSGDREKLGGGLHEYSLFASTGVKLGRARVSVNWSRLELAQGRQQGFGFGLGI